MLSFASPLQLPPGPSRSSGRRRRRRASRPGEKFSGLKQLRASLGDSFRGGAVLYLGRRSYSYDDRLHVLPLDRLWAPA